MTLKEEDTSLTVNYDALEKISWCNTDCQNMMNYTNQIFRGGMDLADPNLVAIIAAANKAITDLTEDIANIKQHLDAIEPIVPVDAKKQKK